MQNIVKDHETLELFAFLSPYIRISYASVVISKYKKVSFRSKRYRQN